MEICTLMFCFCSKGTNNAHSVFGNNAQTAVTRDVNYGRVNRSRNETKYGDEAHVGDNFNNGSGR